MAIQSRSFIYQHEATELQAYIAWDDTYSLPRPGVLVCHDAMGGKSEFEQGRAQALAELGYVGIAIDVFGKDTRADSIEGAMKLVSPLQANPQLLRDRLLAGVNTAASQAEIDSQQLAAIGYCFGGKCVLELARANVGLKGVGSFHGVLDQSTLPTAENLATKILVLHGWDDPFAPPEQVTAFTREMTQAKADWQLYAYGNTVHSFANPNAYDPENGIAYSPLIEQRSWQALVNFLDEIFSG